MLLTHKIEKILSNKIRNKKIAFLGVTFKPNTDDMRESSSLFIIPYLIKKGAKISYCEPSGEKAELLNLKNVKYCLNIKSACLGADLVVIHTEWDEFKTIDFKKVIKNKSVKIYDMRNLYSPTKMKRLGLQYYSIGR